MARRLSGSRLWPVLPGLLLLFTGCGRFAGAPGSPEPAATAAPPAARVPSPPLSVTGEPPSALPLEPVAGAGGFDPILDSPWARAPEMEAQVQRWIHSFQTRESELFRATLARMGRYREMVEAEIRRQRLPPSLLYLPIVESWFTPDAVSWMGAAGLWQFMPPTARGMGLRVNRLVDERRDPFRSTAPALAYLADMRARFGSWFLALAAYNGGPGRMQRILRRHIGGLEGHDGLFLELSSHLPRETRNFVPRFLAAARIARDPAAHGFEDVYPDPPLVFDEVEVPDATSLDVVARAGGVELEVVEALNPQLLRGLTPAGVSTPLRLPAGTGEAFARGYARIPPEERVTFVEHLVAQGETLTHIARLYGVSVGDVQAANPRIRPRRMQIGQRVVVPKAPSAGDRLGSGRSASAEEVLERLVTYQVRTGDTLSGIATRHRVSLGDLLRWNDLTLESVIRPGDRVRIFVPGG